MKVDASGDGTYRRVTGIAGGTAYGAKIEFLALGPVSNVFARDVNTQLADEALTRQPFRQRIAHGEILEGKCAGINEPTVGISDRIDIGILPTGDGRGGILFRPAIKHILVDGASRAEGSGHRHERLVTVIPLLAADRIDKVGTDVEPVKQYMAIFFLLP